MIGIMQGRLLLPDGDHLDRSPLDAWRAEFPAAAAAGLDTIEWVVDAADDNPLWERAGAAAVAAVAAETGVAVASLNADIFRERLRLAGRAPEDRYAARLALIRLIERCSEIGTGRIVVPFVGAASLHSADKQNRAVDALRAVSGFARDRGVRLAVRTDLAPTELRRLLNRLDHAVGVVLDTGADAVVGDDLDDVLAAYGRDIVAVYVSDRTASGAPAPLGTGTVDFPAVFTRLAEVGFCGDCILTVVAGPGRDDITAVADARRFVAERVTGLLVAS